MCTYACVCVCVWGGAKSNSGKIKIYTVTAYQPVESLSLFLISINLWATGACNSRISLFLRTARAQKLFINLMATTCRQVTPTVDWRLTTKCCQLAVHKKVIKSASGCPKVLLELDMAGCYSHAPRAQMAARTKYNTRLRTSRSPDMNGINEAMWGRPFQSSAFGFYSNPLPTVGPHQKGNYNLNCLDIRGICIISLKCYGCLTASIAAAEKTMCSCLASRLNKWAFKRIFESLTWRGITFSSGCAHKSRLQLNFPKFCASTLILCAS